MTVFDRLPYELKVYSIQRLIVLVEALKEASLRDQLTDADLLIEIGGGDTPTAEQHILEFCLNHFGTPYSHETRE